MEVGPGSAEAPKNGGVEWEDGIDGGGVAGGEENCAIRQDFHSIGVSNLR